MQQPHRIIDNITPCPQCKTTNPQHRTITTAQLNNSEPECYLAGTELELLLKLKNYATTQHKIVKAEARCTHYPCIAYQKYKQLKKHLDTSYSYQNTTYTIYYQTKQGFLAGPGEIPQREAIPNFQKDFHEYISENPSLQAAWYLHSKQHLEHGFLKQLATFNYSIRRIYGH